MLCAVYGSARITATAFTTIVFLIAAIMKLIAWPPWANSREKPHSMHDLRFKGRGAALGRSCVDALEVPRREATRVQVVAADLRPPLGPTLEYELELHFTARHQVATCRTRLSHAQAAEYAARSGRWQSTVQDCFASFL